MASLEERLDALEQEAASFVSSEDLDAVWIIWCGIMVFFMQVGFAMLEVGSISPKNTKAVLIKNLTDAALGAICWWTLGNGFAYGTDAGGFIGTDQFAFTNTHFTGNEQGMAYAQWFFQWAFAATAATVVSGAVAERVKIVAYVQISICIIFFIYPVVVHWGWSEGGWASPYRCDFALTNEEYVDCRADARPLLLGCGATDFAGAGIVHMTGAGIAALIAAKVVQTRTGRFRLDGTLNRLPQQSPALQTLGALILWLNNGILSGLVAISASGPLVLPEGAFIVGILASAFYLLGVEALRLLRIDDVVQASAVHFGCGIWGLISVALLTSEHRYQDVYSYGMDVDDEGTKCCGLLYGCGGRLLGANLLFMLALVAWVGTLSYLALMAIKHSVGLRVPLHVEEMGMDKSRHGRQSRGSIALRRALRSAAGPENRSSTSSSRRPSLKSSQTISPRAPPAQLAHWRD
eukprot:jgi/Undpi1/12755/HiC_scaffold_6.g02423.m1